MLKFILLLFFYFRDISCSSSGDLTIIHVYSTECVTEEPQLVLEEGVQWLNDNADFTIQVLSIPLENACELSANMSNSIINGVCPCASMNITNLTDIPQIAYVPFTKISSDQIFNVQPSSHFVGQHLCVLLNAFKWNKIGIITQPNMVEIAEIVKGSCEKNITIIIITEQGVIPDIDIVVFVIIATTHQLENILCQAYDKGLGYPNSMFILPYWYDVNVIRDTATLCNKDQLQTILENTLAFDVQPLENIDTDQALTNLTDLLPFFPNTKFTAYALEALWTLAKLWNESMLSTQALQNLSIPGVQGHISFDETGTRIGSNLNIFQYRQGQYVKIATVSDNLEFLNTSGTPESISTILPGLTEVVGTHPAITIVFYIASSVGVIFALVCLLFNVIFRNKKVMKLSSSNLNYMIIVGSLWLYVNTFFLIFPNRENHPETYAALYNLTYSTTISLSLCDGTIQGKMFRIFYIFHKPNLKKKIITDWHIVIYVCILVAIDLLVYITTLSHSDLRLQVFTYPSSEHDVQSNELGVNTTYYIHVVASPNRDYIFIHFLLIYGFRIILDIISMTLAVLSCFKIQKKIVNEAKSVMAIVYINAIISISNFTLFLTVAKYYTPQVVLGCLSLIVIPTNILSLTFIPKMIAVHKDPEATGLFTVTPVGKPSSSTANEVTL